jgi:penicillin-binding protein 2
MTFLFDPAKGMEALRALEQGWGGTAQQRLEARYAAYATERGASVSRPPRRDEEIFDRVEAEARLAAQQSQAIAEEVIAPRPEANPSGTPAGAAAPPAPAPTAQATLPPAEAATAPAPPATGGAPQ